VNLAGEEDQGSECVLTTSKRRRRTTEEQSYTAGGMHGIPLSLESSRSTGSHATRHRTPNRQPPTYTSQRETTYETDTSWMGDISEPLHGTLALDMDTFQDANPPVVESGSLVESPFMTVGHGSVYQSSINELLSRVCGSQMTPEPVEELLAIYFAWQEPQHMPVDEVLFRRKYLKGPKR
jgi:hypothetical protein